MQVEIRRKETQLYALRRTQGHSLSQSSVFRVISTMRVGTLHLVLCIVTEQRANQANSILEALAHSRKQMLTSGRQLQVWTGPQMWVCLHTDCFLPSLPRTLASVQYLIPYLLKLKVVLGHHSRCIDLFYANLMQARVIEEKGTSTKKMSLQYLAVGKSVWHVLN